ncbi:MAG: T9SS type A sorting domain-containing protein, partial [Calditrichia bacterium]
MGFWNTVSGNNITKQIRYGPVHPDSGGANYWLIKRHLLSSIGLVWQWNEPGIVKYLSGAIINGDTIGVITSIKENNLVIPAEIELSQNYPNPFNPVTTIEYYLPVAAKVELTVYDLTGRKVRKLVNARQQQGTYQVEFDGSMLSSGV